MNNLLKLPTNFLFALLALMLVNCRNQSPEENIVGLYETKDEDKDIVYRITHIRDNIYGIKVEVSFDGFQSQTDYLEGSYNPEERILTTKRSNVILNYQFSPNYETVELLGDENDIELKRR